MGAPIRSATEIAQIINRSQHAIADLGIELVNEAKRGLNITDSDYRDKMYRLKFLRAILHNILDDNADIRLYYQAPVNSVKFNQILDGLVKLSQSFDGPGINIIGVRRNLLFFTGSGSSGGGGGPANPGGTTFQNLDVSSPGENIDTFDANTSTFAMYIYSVQGANPGEGARTGTIIAAWTGSNDPTYAETRTQDVGGITSPITFKVELNAGQIELNAYVSTDGWVVKGVRLLFVNASFINPTGGLPPGGTVGQYVRKSSSANGDAAWATIIISEISGLAAALASYLPLAGGTMSGLIDMGGNRIIGLGPATMNSDAIRSDQVYGVFLNLTGGTMLGDIDMDNTHKIKFLAAATLAGDAVRYDQIYGVFLPLSGGTVSGPIAMGGNKITGLATATNPTDAVRFDQISSSSLSIQIMDVGGFSAPGDTTFNFTGDLTKIRRITALIRDNNTPYVAKDIREGGRVYLNGSVDDNITFELLGGGVFDAANYMGTSVNRGWIIIESTP